MRKVRFAGLLVMGLAACDSGSAITRLGANLTLTPSMIDFGAVPVGATARVIVTAENKGTYVLHICTQASQPSMTCGVLTHFEPNGAPFDAQFDKPDASQNNVWAIEAGNKRTFTVTFTPKVEGAVQGSLVLAHDAKPGPSTTIVLNGSGVAPTLTISPDVLDFGQATVGQKKTLTLNFTNPTQFDIPAKLGPIMQSTVIFDADPQVLVPAMGSATAKVWFVPPDESRQSNRLHVSYCATCNKDITLRGQGAKPAFILTPPALNFGNLQIGDSATQSFQVRNIGNVPLMVNHISPGAGASMDFVSTPQGANLPATIAPNQTLTINVVYTPHMGGTITGSIDVFTNGWSDPASPIDASIGHVAVTAGVIGSSITAVPAAINFGTVPIGGPTVGRNLILENSGSSQLTVSALNLNSPTPDLKIGNMPMLPAAIAPGSSVVIQLTFLPSQAENLSAHLIVVSDDRSKPMLDVPISGIGGTPATCAIDVMPSIVTFGVVDRGRQATLPLVIHNSGAQPCNLSNVALMGGPQFSLAAGAQTSFQIPVNGSETVQVNFLPDGYGSFNTQLVATTDDPSQMMLQVPIDGASAPSGLVVVPSSIDFGTVPAMCGSPLRAVTLYNTGNTPVTVDLAYLDPSTPPSFELQSYPTPATIQGGQSSVIALRYHPTAIGRETGVLFIQHSASVVPVAIPLSGDGEVMPVVNDTFHQAATPQADVLFVIDNSGSMQWAQGNIGQNLSSFMQSALQQNVDYHVAVTTTDVELPGSDNGGRSGPGAHGAFVSNPKIITPQTPNALGAFQSSVNVGTRGSGLERGLEAAYLALSDPNINTVNAGFLRQGASLAVVLVSDDDDTRQDDRGNGQCPGGNPGGPNEIPGPGARPVDFYVSFFHNIKGFQNTTMFSFNSVTEMSPCECSGTGDDAEAVGWRYMQVASQTGGVTASICQSTWSQTLATIGQNSFGLRMQFPLSSQPVPSTIAVTVNGQTVPSGGYTYDTVTNSIIFPAASVPPANATVSITYSVACF